MKRKCTLFAFLLCACSLLSRAADGNRRILDQIVPAPAEIEARDGFFNVREAKCVCSKGIDARTKAAVNAFSSRTGCRGKKNSITFSIDPSLAPESYSIDITPRKVKVVAAGRNAVLYSIQTLRQMLPAAVYLPCADLPDTLRLPCCRINDRPQFAWRGAMLDVARHFYGVSEVKRLLDMMSFFKMNRFHWHLTDDQGWRLPIEKYPLLTGVGSRRECSQIGKNPFKSDSIPHGGFYSREEIAAVVAYADSLGIEVVPEIDLPGHMLAALASYPYLGCRDSKPRPYKVRTQWGVSRQVLCVGKDSTMTFLENVLDEVCGMFPSRYIHIGGDECPKDEWKSDPDCQALIARLGLKDDDKASAEDRLQNWVTARIQDYLASKGRKIIGWDEILKGELAPGATVMSWRGTKGGIAAAKAGYDVIMSPNEYCYLNWQQSMYFDEEPLGQMDPKHFRGALTLRKSYSFNPVEDIPEEFRSHILGVQANVWTEWISTCDHLEYMLLPRLLAVSEVQWCSPQRKNYDRFLSSLETHQLDIFRLLGYNFRALGHDTMP